MTKAATKAATKATAQVQSPVKVTNNEITLLLAIVAEAKRLKVDILEMAVPCVNPFESKHVGSGTYASVMRKELVVSQDYGTANHAVYLTDLGMQVVKAYQK